MNHQKDRLRSIVLAWTIFTSVFTWTPTMRAFLKPEISKWGFLGFSGQGREGAFWILPTLALLVLFMFYLEGRGKFRPLFYALLLAWHVPLSLLFTIGALRRGQEAKFIGAAWGWEVSFAVLSIAFIFFTVLAIIWIIREVRHDKQPDEIAWNCVDWKKLIFAALLLPVAILFFGIGQAFDWFTRIAIVATVIQWITLAEALGFRGEKARV